MTVKHVQLYKIVLKYIKRAFFGVMNEQFKPFNKHGMYDVKELFSRSSKIMGRSMNKIYE
jgi:hypothetical protein